MKQVYQTLDAKTFDDFRTARMHEIMLAENALGKIIDRMATGNGFPTSVVGQRIHLHDLLVDHRMEILPALHAYHTAVALSEEDYNET